MREWQHKEANIVLLGVFNPKIFQPAWLAAQGLIRQEEADSADVGIIHRDVAVFKLDWALLQVVRERFQIGPLKEGHDQEIRDLVVGMFRLLTHTPLHAMGINKTAHLPMESVDAWHALGHRLAPKDLWNEILENPGMRSLSIQGVRPDGLKGFVHVKIEPSTVLQPGLCVEVNDHYEVQDKKTTAGAEEIIGILDKMWLTSYQRSEQILAKIMEKI